MDDNNLATIEPPPTTPTNAASATGGGGGNQTTPDDMTRHDRSPVDVHLMTTCSENSPSMAMAMAMAASSPAVPRPQLTPRQKWLLAFNKICIQLVSPSIFAYSLVYSLGGVRDALPFSLSIGLFLHVVSGYWLVKDDWILLLLLVE